MVKLLSNCIIKRTFEALQISCYVLISSIKCVMHSYILISIGDLAK